MKYTQPAGKPADAPYVDGNRSAGIRGDIPPADAIENPQRELDHLIEFSGQTPNHSDLEQVRKAVEAMIDAATGGGSTSNFVLLSQARARLPIFPEVQTGDGRIGVFSTGAGNVRVPASVTFLHRGIFPVTPALTDLACSANKTYHLRWNPTDGFALKDLANAGYNAGALAETNEIFDSGYDDMLVARVVTNGSNVPTITNLSNRTVLRTKGVEFAAKGSLASFQTEDGVSPNAITQGVTVDINYARTPDAYLTAVNDVMMDKSVKSLPTSQEFNVGVRPLSRYQIRVWGQGDTDIFTGWAVRA